MSSTVLDNSSEFLFESTSANGGLQVVAQQDQENIIEIEGDAELGITGGGLKDTINTGAGDAIIFAGGGDDMVMTGNGNDIVRGGDGDDLIATGSGADVLIGGEGNDILRSGKAALDADGKAMGMLNEKGELVLPTTEDDESLAEASPAQLYGDVLKGGSGDDIFQFSADEFMDGVVDKIVDFKDDDFADTIQILGVGAEGNVTYDDQTGIVSVNGTEAIDIGAGQDVDFKANEDNDNWTLF